MLPNGRIFCSGRRHPLPARPNPPSRNDADMILTKCRRETGSAHSLASGGNSRSTHCRNSGVSDNSSRLRQYLRPDLGSGHVGGIVFILWSGSSVARRTRLQRLNLPVPQHLTAVQVLQPLSFLRVVAPFPVQISNFLRRTELGRRVAMTIEAESHA